MLQTILLSFLITTTSLIVLHANKRLYTVDVLSTGQYGNWVLGTRIFFFKKDALEFVQLCEKEKVTYRVGSSYVRMC